MYGYWICTGSSSRSFRPPIRTGRTKATLIPAGSAAPSGQANANKMLTVLGRGLIGHEGQMIEISYFSMLRPPAWNDAIQQEAWLGTGRIAN